MRQRPYVIACTIVAALGGLLFGFDTAVISGTTDALTARFNLSSFTLGFTVASALIGTIGGAVLVGKPADIWGRRSVMFVIAALYFVSALGSALAWDWWSFVVFRFMGGLAVGGASVVSPMYIAEIAPASMRGRLVAVTQFNIVLGILLAYISNAAVLSLELGDLSWRWMFGIEAIPAVAYLLLLFTVPRSPRWLMAVGQTEEARSVLMRVGTDAGNVDAELHEIRESLDLAHHSLREPFFRRRYRKPILLAVAIAMFNQLSGINALMYYAPTIFKMAGAGEESAFLQAVAVGGTNLVFTIAAMAIIDAVGRRKLMVVGSLGYIVSLSTVAGVFYAYGTEFDNVGATTVLIALLVFIASHAFGQGAVIWVFLSEIFPNRVRARGQALGSVTHWVMAAAISWTFPIIADISGGHVFAIYAACSVGQLVWVLLVMPETKGVPLEEIQKQLNIE